MGSEVIGNSTFQKKFSEHPINIKYALSRCIYHYPWLQCRTIRFRYWLTRIFWVAAYNESWCQIYFFLIVCCNITNSFCIHLDASQHNKFSKHWFQIQLSFRSNLSKQPIIHSNLYTNFSMEGILTVLPYTSIDFYNVTILNINYYQIEGTQPPSIYFILISETLKGKKKKKTLGNN